jgi:hypothetical protein
VTTVLLDLPGVADRAGFPTERLRHDAEASEGSGAPDQP